MKPQINLGKIHQIFNFFWPIIYVFFPPNPMKFIVIHILKQNLPTKKTETRTAREKDKEMWKMLNNIEKTEACKIFLSGVVTTVGNRVWKS